MLRSMSTTIPTVIIALCLAAVVTMQIMEAMALSVF
jgi:hypothetical protein